MKRGALVVGIACLLVSSVAGSRSDASADRRILVGETVYDITKYKAKGDGQADDAMVIN